MKLMSEGRGDALRRPGTQRIHTLHLKPARAFPTMRNSPHILIAGGGLDGQLGPGLTVAEQLARKVPDATVTFAGPSGSPDEHVVRSAGYDYLSVPAQPVPTNVKQAIRFVADNVAGYCAARWLFREHQVSLVVGLGGYRSAPVVKAAACRGIPFVLAEQDVAPSRIAQWLGHRSELVCVPFEQTQQQLDAGIQTLCTGNVVGPAFVREYRKQKSTGCSQILRKDPTKKRLLVLEGACQATSLNVTVPGALRQLGATVDDWEVVHQTGEGQLQRTERSYQKAQLDVLAVTRIDELAAIVFQSDLVICRAGGTTLAQLALAGVPALLVPLPEGQGGSQVENAKMFQAAGAASLIEETDQIGSLQSALTRQLKLLLPDAETRAEMSANTAALARPDSSADLADAICDLLFGKRESKRLAA